jgi:hypothetical protein
MARPQHDQPTTDTVLGTAHAAQIFGCDPSTLRNYAVRGIVSPITSSTGRRMWRMEDLRAISDHRRSRGLPDGGALLGSRKSR